MFHPGMDKGRQKELLDDVVDDDEIVRKPFVPSERSKSDGLNQWERLRVELMQENRYFQDAQLNTDRLKEHLTRRADEVHCRRW
jgi:hypothetical protein